jgi:hypothetical protein
MNPRLKRIEATLDQLSVQNPAPQESLPANSADDQVSGQPAATQATGQTPSVPRLPSFPIAQQRQTQPTQSAHLTDAAVQPRPSTASTPPAQPRQKTTAEAITPFSAKESYPQSSVPSQSNTASLSSHHAINPNLAVGLMNKIEAVVMAWQMEMDEISLQIQTLYKEGPIVDGWLESHPYEAHQATYPTGAAMLRHAEIEHLMDYVEEICSAQHPQILDEPSCTGYRLCGLDADGQLWSRPCPPQQVPYVGLAIARYQKLRVLLGRKQSLENRLNHLVQSLATLHSQVREP